MMMTQSMTGKIALISAAAAAVHDGFAATIPMKRYGTPGEVAGMVAFLASDIAAYVNGAA